MARMLTHFNTENRDYEQITLEKLPDGKYLSRAIFNTFVEGTISAEVHVPAIDIAAYIRKASLSPVAIETDSNTEPFDNSREIYDGVYVYQKVDEITIKVGSITAYHCRIASK
jgi:hypothetical protein